MKSKRGCSDSDQSNTNAFEVDILLVMNETNRTFKTKYYLCGKMSWTLKDYTQMSQLMIFS